MKTQREVNEASWIFPGDFALRSFEYVASQAPDAEAIVIIGMPNFRRADGLPQRPVSILREIEAAIGKPIVSSDCALYWNIFRTLGVAPQGQQCQLLASLQRAVQ